jgi:DNA-directed RNA polymerase specialized sigma subunit
MARAVCPNAHLLRDEGLSQAQVAARMGISLAEVQQLERSALSKLRAALEWECLSS